MNTNKTFENLKDIIASDLKLAIELIKGQKVNVKDFVNYLMEFNEIKIEGKYIEMYYRSIGDKIFANQIPILHNGWCLTIVETQLDDEEPFKAKLIKYLKYLCKKK